MLLTWTWRDGRKAISLFTNPNQRANRAANNREVCNRNSFFSVGMDVGSRMCIIKCIEKDRLVQCINHELVGSSQNDEL